MWRWLAWRSGDGPPLSLEPVPGLAPGVRLTQIERWRLAGDYRTRHQLVGLLFRRVCVTCGTKGGCVYGRWADEVLVGQARRDWLGG
jgi:hypothetical protein